jgi:GNAT superfamily N-acetyltransferase
MNFKFLSEISDKQVKEYMDLANKVIENVHSIGFLEPLDLEATEKLLNKQIKVQNSALLFIDNKEKLVGTGYIAPSGYQTTKHYCAISKVMVDPDAQGKGIGTQIMLKLEVKAKDMGYTHVLLNTWDIPSIVEFYKNCGYAVVGKIPDFVFYKGHYHDSYYFAKKLF